MKIYLQKYESPMFQSLNSTSFHYNLFVKKVYLWGLVKKDEIIPFEVQYHQNLKSFHDHWDRLIQTQQPLK